MTGSNYIPIKHRFLGFFNAFKNKIMWFNLYRKTYSNFLNVVMNDFQDNYPIKAILRNNVTKNLESKDEVALHTLLAAHKNVNYDVVREKN